MTDLVGKRFHQLLITHDLGYKKVHMIRCKCDCSNIIDAIYDNVKRGHTKSCGCLRDRLLGESYKDITTTYWSRVKYCAERRNIDFNISMSDAWHILEKQNFKCVFTGKPLIVTNRRLNGNASIDRINSNKQYTIENIRWIDKEVNLMKSNFDDQRFLYWCNLTSKYNIQLSSEFISKVIIKNSRFKGIGDISKEFWGKIGRTAKKRDIDLLISIEEAWKLFEYQQYKCALTGTLLYMPTKKINGVASLDRIDYKLNYINGNVQWVHKDVNRIKLCLDNYELKNICTMITNNQNVML